ncbi:MAG TPA: hypothetical protein VJ810_40185 [Blastocatellia bacterium]|nr:hypothetical protein [Blastocatellia bacterium]
MTSGFCLSMLGLLAVMTILTGEAYADTFEFLTYTPPRGWMNQASQDGRIYRRASGIGLIAFYASYPATGPASDEFVRMWRARVEPTLPGPAPKPQLQPDGDYVAAIGAQRVDAQGAITTISLVTIVGRGRAIGVLAMAAGDEADREVTAFLNTIDVAPGTPAATASKSGSVPGVEIEVDFDAPPGYVSRRDGRMVVLTPTTVDEKTPCAYGVSPARPSNGALDSDARAAILEALPGWQLKSDSYNAMRGVAGDGWPYFWFRADVQRLVAGSYEYATAMTMAFPAGPGRVNIVWGVGNPARCTLDDLAFARLFHSLRPRGWNSDGGKALSRDLQGTWRNSQRVGIAQYKFMANGRYEFGIGTSTTTGLLERTSSSVSDGRYELRGAELTITPDRRDRGVSKYRVRIYDEFVLGRWTRAMSLLDENAKPALEAQYMRIEDSR